MQIPIVYLATVRRDCRPRLHPVSPILAAGRLFAAIEGTSPKRYDLARNGYYSLHALPPQLDGQYDEFEFNLSGLAARISDAAVWEAASAAERARDRRDIEPASWLFELRITTALTTVWDHRPMMRDGRWIFTGTGKATRRIWHAQ